MNAQLERLREAPVELRETGLVAAAAPAGGSRRKITIIQAGWGSSGFYGREMLERDGPTAWPVGTQMFLDHPSQSESADRPERSVKDLAARIASTPVMEGGELVAEADIFAHWAPVIDALAGDIGLSIRAVGTSEAGEAEGREGPIITAITEGISVDFVTRAGAGGKLGDLIESARSLGETLQSTLADQLCAAGQERWANSITYVYLDDYDPDQGWAVFCISPQGGDRQYVQVAYETDGSDVALAADGQEVRRTTAYEPVVTPAIASERQEGSAMADNDTLEQLQEAARQHETQLGELQTERDREKDRADRAEEKLQMVEARAIVEKTVGEVEGLSDKAQARAVESALREKIPVGDDGVIDAEKLTERAQTAAKAEQDYLAEATTPVHGMGPSGKNGMDDSAEKLAEAFKRLGSSDKAAQIAAAGR